MSEKINIGLVGLGKIAHDQHLPALAASTDFNLTAVTQGTFLPPPGARVYPTLDAMLAEAGDLEAVTLCTPPQGRHALAQAVLDRGWHVMLEKPPGQSVSEVEGLMTSAERRGLALFGAWHSREAPGVEPARRWLEQATLRDVHVVWHEDVRRWHPKQGWIWEAGGMGVFDAGINALSIVTRIVPHALNLDAARLWIPGNRAMPIAAQLDMRDSLGIPVRADFDWRQLGEQVWTITVDTDQGRLRLSEGGAALSIRGESVELGPIEPNPEYRGLYRRFAALVEAKRVDADTAPLRLVAESFARGARIPVAPFED